MAPLLAMTPMSGGARAQVITRADYEACQAKDDASFRAAVEAVTIKSMQTGMTGLDEKVRTLVATEWLRVDMNAVIDRQVDTAIADATTNTALRERLQSLVDNEKAQALATSVAENVYGSENFKARLGDIASGVTQNLLQSLQITAAEASRPASECLEAFLGPRYGQTIARTVKTEVGRSFQIDAAKVRAPMSTGAVMQEHLDGLTGAVVVLVRRQLSNMASRIGQRLVGVVLGRVVGMVTGILGIGLLAKDIWDSTSGVLPIIADEMKAKATKDKVQEEIAKTVSDQFRENMRDLASKAADGILGVWQEFRKAHGKVLELAEANPAFRAFLDRVRTERLPRLDEMVGVILASEGEPAILKRLGDGSLDEIVNTMPDAGAHIAREQRSVSVALQWTRLAGTNLAQVVDSGLYARAAPETFTAATLGRVLALADQAAIRTVGGLPAAARDTLLAIETAKLRLLAKAVDAASLETLAGYLSGLNGGPRERLLQAVIERPARMQTLGSARVRNAILSSRDQAAAVDMMLRTDSGFDIRTVSEDVRLAIDGKVDYVLLWDRHPLAGVGLGFAALVLVLILRRLFGGGRRRRPELPVERTGTT